MGERSVIRRDYVVCRSVLLHIGDVQWLSPLVVSNIATNSIQYIMFND